jgi:hypothetical protein
MISVDPSTIVVLSTSATLLGMVDAIAIAIAITVVEEFPAASA